MAERYRAAIRLATRPGSGGRARLRPRGGEMLPAVATLMQQLRARGRVAAMPPYRPRRPATAMPPVAALPEGVLPGTVLPMATPPGAAPPSMPPPMVLPMVPPRGGAAASSVMAGQGAPRQTALRQTTLGQPAVPTGGRPRTLPSGRMGAGGHNRAATGALPVPGGLAGVRATRRAPPLRPPVLPPSVPAATAMPPLPAILPATAAAVAVRAMPPSTRPAPAAARTMARTMPPVTRGSRVAGRGAGRDARPVMAPPAATPLAPGAQVQRGRAAFIPPTGPPVAATAWPLAGPGMDIPPRSGPGNFFSAPTGLTGMVAIPPGMPPRATGQEAAMPWVPRAGGNARSARLPVVSAQRMFLPRTARPPAVTPAGSRPYAPGAPVDRTPVQPFVPQRGAGQAGRQQAGRPPFISPQPPGAGQVAPVAAQAGGAGGGPVVQVTIPLTLDHHVLGQAMARIDTSRALHEHRATGTAPDGLRHAQLPGRSIGA